MVLVQHQKTRTTTDLKQVMINAMRPDSFRTPLISLSAVSLDISACCTSHCTLFQTCRQTNALTGTSPIDKLNANQKVLLYVDVVFVIFFNVHVCCTTKK